MAAETGDRAGDLPRRRIDGACARIGREPLSLAGLRRLSPEFRHFEAVAPAGWIALIERAVEGDVEALEPLDAECERRGGGQPVH